MFVKSLISCIRPGISLTQARFIRPSIKLGKNIFQLSIDVRQFKREELRVKARAEYVLIEGKQERKTARGCITRKFVRKYKLPQGCHPSTMNSTLSVDGVLTVTAPRSVCSIDMPCETVVPIKFTESTEDSLVTVQKPGGNKKC